MVGFAASNRIICAGRPPAREYEKCICDDQTDDGSYPYLDCWGKQLSDGTLKRYLNAFLNQPNVTGLKLLELGDNKLTRVPDEIKRFLELEWVNLRQNSIHTIHSGAFNFIARLRYLNLEYNQLSKIEPGAFQGINACSIKLDSCNLRFIVSIVIRQLR